MQASLSPKSNPKPKVKVCGITNLEDAILAARLGANALGFIFYPRSPRVVTPDTVRKIVKNLPVFLSRVGVFVNSPVEKIKEVIKYCHLDIVQLHGQEPPEFPKLLGIRTIKAWQLKDEPDLDLLASYHVSAFLLDSYDPNLPGGTGKTFNWEWALEVKRLGKPIILSGGLSPDNVSEAVLKVRPYAVDVCSGVEKMPGKKDEQKLKEFFQTLNL